MKLVVSKSVALHSCLQSPASCRFIWFTFHFVLFCYIFADSCSDAVHSVKLQLVWCFCRPTVLFLCVSKIKHSVKRKSILSHQCSTLLQRIFNTSPVFNPTAEASCLNKIQYLQC